ncbi:MAG TPA: hypothetical protein VFX18_06115 [Candidatus Nitrosocosmicus sp.]|nr:hypothetical protein [Candidatus Nitrosocosmicus sp.]
MQIPNPEHFPEHDDSFWEELINDPKKMTTIDPDNYPKTDPPYWSDPDYVPDPGQDPVTGGNPETPPGGNPADTPPIEYNTPFRCEWGLQLPRMMPLLHALEDSFPFSIPFDIKKAIDATFSGMSSEKPSFTFVLMDEEFNITIPDYFDSWKPFTDSALLIIFDIGLLMIAYRFLGGGGS